MSQVIYQVRIRMLTPFNISTGERLSDYVNKSTIKYKGKPYIPASTIKGKIRNNFYAICDLNHKGENCGCPMCRIFGRPGFGPSRIYIEDFVTDEEPSTLIRYGVAIDRYRKTAKENVLFAEELSGNRVFRGKIKVYFDEHTINYKDKLEMAIKMIDSVGNGRSKGHGHAEITLEEVS